MSNSPTVSVLTTVYNRAKFLGECIESVQQSRFSDYEHIIVDDGSTDDSVAIAKRYAAQDSRIKVFVNEKNLGDYPNRNQAAKHASGKYLKYLDADDLHGPWILNVIVDAMEQFPDAGFGIIDHGPNVPTFPILLTGSEAQDDYYSKRRNIFSRSPINVIIKREAFLEIGGFGGGGSLRAGAAAAGDGDGQPGAGPGTEGTTRAPAEDSIAAGKHRYKTNK